MYSKNQITGIGKGLYKIKIGSKLVRNKLAKIETVLINENIVYFNVSVMSEIKKVLKIT